MRLGIIGVPYTSTGLGMGEARAPAALRAAGLVAALRRSAEVVDYGDIEIDEASPRRDPETAIIAPASLVQMVTGVQQAVRTVLDDGSLPLVIGGECPLMLGCLAAAREARGRLGLLFVDGHEDAWPSFESTTGEAADMELGFALGLTQPHGIEALTSMLPLVRPEDVVVLGPRDRDEIVEEQVASVAPTVALFRDDVTLRRDLQPSGFAPLMAQRFSGPGHWWFHLDLDVLATSALPAVRYPQPGGLDWNELSELTAAALGMPGLVGWNLTIYNPDLDPDGSGAARIVAFLAEAGGRMMRGADISDQFRSL